MRSGRDEATLGLAVYESRDADDGVREATAVASACSENLTLRLKDCAVKALRLWRDLPLRGVGRSLGCLLAAQDDPDAVELDAEPQGTSIQCPLDPSDEEYSTSLGSISSISEPSKDDSSSGPVL